MIQLLKFSPLLLIALGAAALVLLWGRSPPGGAVADGSGPRMALNVAGEGVLCDAASEPTLCAVPLAGRFALAVQVMGAPAEGYVAFQSQVFYDGLAYQPRDVADEIVWPESALPVRFPAAPTGQERLVSHGDASGTQPPFPASNHAGSVIELDLVCSAEPRSFTLALLPYDAAARPLGAGFSAAAPGGGVGSAVPAKTAGTAPLDLDGDTTAETVAIADGLEVRCGGAVSTPSDTPTPTPTATPAATATPTSSPTPTATPPGPAGDANCDRDVTSVDAALILQHEAGLLRSLRCPRNADVNGDGAATSIDAALVLQFVAGLIDRLPPR